MTDATLALCKSVVGIAAWLVGMCASNQAIHSAPVSLAELGEVLRQEIEAPMDERYELVVRFDFSDQGALERSVVAGRAGGAGLTACFDDEAYRALPPDQQSQLGLPLELRLTLMSPTGGTSKEATFQSRCVQSWGHLSKTRHLGYIDIPKGRHKVVVTNRRAVPAEQGVRSSILLVGVGAAFK